MNIKLILILALVSLDGAQTVELSALNYGTADGKTWQEWDAKYVADIKAILDNHCKVKVGL
jgi:hypothetical protein